MIAEQEAENLLSALVASESVVCVGKTTQPLRNVSMPMICLMSRRVISISHRAPYRPAIAGFGYLTGSPSSRNQQE